jgi:hypothetical protein
MFECPPLLLDVEILWPDDASLRNGVAARPRPLPVASPALRDLVFPRRPEDAPASLLALAVRLVAPPTHAAPTPNAPTPAILRAEPLDLPGPPDAPTLAGIAIAARYSALQRGADEASTDDALAALYVAADRRVAASLAEFSRAAVAAVATRGAAAARHLTPDARAVVWWLARYGLAIALARLGEVMPVLMTVLGCPVGEEAERLTAPTAFARALLRRLVPPQAVDRLLVEHPRVYSVAEAIAGTPIESARVFLQRVCYASMNRDVGAINMYVLQLLDEAGGAPDERVDDADGVRQTSGGRVHLRTIHARATDARAALSPLLPAHGALAEALVGKAALLGTGVQPSPAWLIGQSREARLLLLRTLARATDAALVTLEARDVISNGHLDADALLARVHLVEQPDEPGMTSGTIFVVDGSDDLRVSDEVDAERLPRLAGQRTVAQWIAQGVPITSTLPEWPRAPVWFVCSADGAARREGRFSLETDGGFLTALHAHVRDELKLGELSIAFLVELLRPRCRANAEIAAVMPTLLPRLATVEVPEVTLATAARLAHAQHSDERAAWRAIEAAAARAVLRRAREVTDTRLVIAPDDLSVADIHE